MNTAWFQGDGARPDTSSAILRFLCDVSEERVLSNRYPALFGEGFSWPPTTPYLISCDYFLWRYKKDRTFQEKPRTIRELKTAMQLEIEAVSVETLTRVLHNFVLHLLKFVIFGNITWNMLYSVERSMKVVYHFI
jgi:hypothetical protein